MISMVGKSVKQVVFKLWTLLGPKDPFHLFSLRILCPMGPEKDKKNCDSLLLMFTTSPLCVLQEHQENACVYLKNIEKFLKPFVNSRCFYILAINSFAKTQWDPRILNWNVENVIFHWNVILNSNMLNFEFVFYLLQSQIGLHDTLTAFCQYFSSKLYYIQCNTIML